MATKSFRLFFAVLFAFVLGIATLGDAADDYSVDTPDLTNAPATDLIIGFENYQALQPYASKTGNSLIFNQQDRPLKHYNSVAYVPTTEKQNDLNKRTLQIFILAGDTNLCFADTQKFKPFVQTPSPKYINRQYIIRGRASPVIL